MTGTSLGFIVAGTLVLWTTGLAAAPVSAEAGPSDSVLATADSVLRAVSFATSLGGKPANRATADIPTINPRGLMPPFTPETRVRIQGAFCRLNGLDRCPIFDGEAQGTAFVLARPGEVVTCRHLVQDWLYWATALNGGRPRPVRLIPPIFLVDRSRSSVTSTWRSGYRVLLFVDDQSLMAPISEVRGESSFWDADILGFSLASKSLPAPLLRSDAPFAVGDPVHAFGFAADKSGPRLHVMAGKVLRSDGLDIETDISTRHGMSGSPLIDQTGRAVAVSCARDRSGGRRGGGAVGLPLDLGTLNRELRDRWGMVPIVDPAMH